MKKNIYITRTIPEVGINLLKEKGYKVTVSKKNKVPTKEELINALSKKKYDAVVSLLTDHINVDVLNVCPNVKIIANYAVGFNNIDVEEAEKRGIVVTNTAGTSSQAVAEHTVALMFAVTTRLVEGDRFVRKGKFKGWDPNLLMGLDISKKTIGVIGLGAIGKKVGHILKKGFDCKIIYNDIKRDDSFENDCGGEYMSIDEVLKNADIVTLHVPLLPSTKHLINKEKISLMKRTAIIINTSRGPVVEEEAIVEALKEKRIYGAGLDVFEFEPHISDEFKKLDNIVMTPHIASSRASAREEMATLVAKNIIDVLEGGKGITPVKL